MAQHNLFSLNLIEKQQELQPEEVEKSQDNGSE